MISRLIAYTVRLRGTSLPTRPLLGSGAGGSGTAVPTFGIPSVHTASIE